MEEQRHYTKNPQFPYPEPSSALRRSRAHRGKPFAHFLCKACFFVLVIVLVPLFPSQAPGFISESVVSKFWELIHLLFVGIAVSYGLFCRRNDEVDIEVESKFDSLEHGMSRMFHVSSRSEEGHESLCGFDGKKVVEDLSGNPNVSLGENSSGNGTVQAWNSQYFQGGSMVVVARPNCGFGEFGEPASEVDYKPLGLPVRSLKSRIRKRDKRESSHLVSGNESGSVSFDSIKSFNESRDEKFGDLGPGDSENRFNEAVVSPSPIPWRSRSVRTEMMEKVSPASGPAHFRTLSVDDMQFESKGAMRTPSLRSTVSFSSRASSVSSSQGDDSPVHSVASEVMDSKVEEEEKETSFRSSYASSGSPSPPKPVNHNVRKAKSSQGSSASGSQSPPRPMEDKASSSALHARGHSFGSFYEDELRGPKVYLKGLIESRRDDVLDSKESGTSSLKLDLKKLSFGKASSRGKSVRTIRTSRLTTKAENWGDVQGNKVADHDVETTLLGKETTGDKGVDSLVNGNTEQSFDCSSPVPKLTIGKDQTREIQELSDNASAKPGEDVEIKAEKFRLSTSEEADSESVHGTRTPDSYEVDKKAGEFIAKFREQIRLQKVASMDRSRGLRFGANNFR